MTACALPPRFRAARRSAPAWIAVTWAELILRLRDTNVPILVACAAAACVLLTPSADAGYAVITFGGMKPAMAGSTSLVAAGLVLSMLMFPVYALVLGVGCSRDRRLGTGATIASSPVDPFSITCGRMASNSLVVLLFSAVTLALIALSVASRFQSVPGIASMAAYLLVVVPAGLCALPLGALMDRYLGDRDGAKAFATILFWSVLMTGSLLARPDIFGFDFVRQNAPAGTASDFSLGFVSAEQMARIPWKVLQLTATFVMARIGLLAALAVTSAFVCWVARAGLMQAITRAAVRSSAGTVSAVHPEAADLPRIRPSATGPLRAGWIIASRWFKPGKLVGALFITAFVIALVSPSIRLALGAALLIPLAIVNGRRISGIAEVRNFERSTAAFWRPSPLLFTAMILLAVTVTPLVPVLARLPLLRGIHVAVAGAAAALWLTWTCAAIARPLLGISVYALAWYLECFSDLPAAVDLMGIGATSPVSLAAAAALSLGLGVLVFRKDCYGYRSSARA